MFFPRKDDEAESDLTIKQLRNAIKGLAGTVVIITEDGNFNQSATFAVKICTHIATGDGSRLIPEDRIEEHKQDGYVIYKLDQPVLCLEMTGLLKTAVDG